MTAHLLSTGKELMAWSLEETTHVPLSVRTSLDVIAAGTSLRMRRKMQAFARLSVAPLVWVQGLQMLLTPIHCLCTSRTNVEPTQR
jgi:hypothetical protein